MPPNPNPEPEPDPNPNPNPEPGPNPNREPDPNLHPHPHEVAKCAPDHLGEWHGEWEECTVMAEGPLTCDVIITSDGQCVRDVPRRFVRERPPERQLERQPAAAPAAAAPAGAVPAGAVETTVGAAARCGILRSVGCTLASKSID